MTTWNDTVAAQRIKTVVEDWLDGPSGEVQITEDGVTLQDVLHSDDEARVDLERRIAEVLARAADSVAYVDRLRHDLHWQYDEVAYLRTAIQRALNAVLRPPALEWPGDEHPMVEASRILSEALSPARRHQ